MMLMLKLMLQLKTAMKQKVPAYVTEGDTNLESEERWREMACTPYPVSIP